MRTNQEHHRFNGSHDYKIIPTFPFLLCLFGLIVDIECAIQLDSVPQNLSIVNPGESVTFICRTTGSTIIAWSSIEYIDRGGAQLTFLSINDPGTMKNISNSASFATLTMVDRANLVLESQLHLVNVTVMSTVICFNNDQGVNASISFRVESPSTTTVFHTTDTVSQTTVPPGLLPTTIIIIATVVPGSILILVIVTIILIFVAYCVWKKGSRS